MGFEVIINEESGAAAPTFENGAKIQYCERKQTKDGGSVVKYIKIQLGRNTAAALSFVSDKHNCKLLFGNGEDAGQIAVQVDNKDGDFPAVRNKAKQVTITIKGETAARWFKFGFTTIYLDKIDMIAMPGSAKMGILHLAKYPEIFAKAPTAA